MRTKIIVFAGIDGSGKTTHAKILLADFQKRLKGKKIAYIWNRWDPFFPKPAIFLWRRFNTKRESDRETYSFRKSKKRHILKNRIIRMVWWCFFLADYCLQTWIKVKGKQLFCDVVILDRSYIDTFVDQSINFQAGFSKLVKILNSFWLKTLFYDPDVVFFIDLPEEKAFVRKKETGMTKEYLQDRRKIFSKLCETLRWIKINGDQDIELVSAEIKEKLANEVR